MFGGSGNRIDKASGDWYQLVKRNFVQAVHGNIDIAAVHETHITKTFTAIGTNIKLDAPVIFLKGVVELGDGGFRNGYNGSFVDINGAVVQVVNGVIKAKMAGN